MGVMKGNERFAGTEGAVIVGDWYLRQVTIESCFPYNLKLKKQRTEMSAAFLISFEFRKNSAASLRDVRGFPDHQASVKPV